MTVGLTVIAQNALEASRLISKYYDYFDEIYLQLNGEDIGEFNFKKVPKVKLSRFKWRNDFSAARNALHKHIKTDYWVWADCDDDLKGIGNLGKIIGRMERDHIDVWYAPYEYAYDENGDVITRQYRERIMRTAMPVVWKGAVHETIIPVDYEPRIYRSDDIVWQHIKTEAETKASSRRNHQILLKEWKRERDPRTAFYLGMSFFGLKDWANARQYFADHIRSSGWDEERYRSWLKIAESHSFEKDTEKQIAAYLMAQKEMPERPDHLFGLADAHFDKGEFKKCLEYLDMAYDKPVPKSNSVNDPTVYTYRSLMMKALALWNLNRVKEAYIAAKQAGTIQPNYKVFKEVFPTIEEAYYLSEAIEHTKWLASYLKDNKGDLKKLLEALPQEIAFHPTLAPERSKAYPPRQWPPKSIAWFCGQSPEQWGPDTLEDGMGGSEEAVVYLTRELAKLGYQVTVYNTRDTGLTHDGVTFLPWHAFNPKDTFDVFVAWRNPGLCQHVKARVKLLDMHDTPVGHQTVTDDDLKHVDWVMVKSNYQAKLGKLPKHKTWVVGNGIVASQFGVPSAKV